MKSRRALALLAIGLSAAVASCSILTSFDGLTGGGEAIDAGLDVLPGVDGSQIDGASDAPILDARADAPDAPDGDAGPWCSQHPSQFCVDFDQPPSITARWDGISYPFGDAGAATVALDGLSFSSGPNSALVKLPVGESCRFAGLQRKVAAADMKGAQLGYDLRMTSAVGHQGTLLAVGFPNWACNYLVAQSNTGATYVYEQAFQGDTTERSSMSHFFKKPVVPGAWSRIELDIVVTGAVQTLSVKLDGSQVVGPTPLLADCQSNGINGAPAGVYLRLGFHCQTDSAELRYDNVTLDVTK